MLHAPLFAAACLPTRLAVSKLCTWPWQSPASLAQLGGGGGSEVSAWLQNVPWAFLLSTPVTQELEGYPRALSWRL